MSFCPQIATFYHDFGWFNSKTITSVSTSSLQISNGCLWNKTFFDRMFCTARFDECRDFFLFPNTCWLKRELPRPSSFGRTRATSCCRNQSMRREKKKKKNSAKHFFVINQGQSLLNSLHIWGPSVCGELKDWRDFSKVFFKIKAFSSNLVMTSQRWVLAPQFAFPS